MMMVEYHQINMRWMLMMKMTKRRMFMISVITMTILMTKMTLKVLVLTISGETSGEMSRHDGTHT